MPVNSNLITHTKQHRALFFTYARTWRNLNNNLLYTFIKQNPARLRVILPNPDNEIILNELSNRFSKSSDEFKLLINDAKNEYTKLAKVAESINGAAVELWLVSVTPMFTFYRFDETVVLALGSYKNVKGDIPHFIAKKNGYLYKFIEEELRTLIAQDARQISKQIL